MLVALDGSSSAKGVLRLLLEVAAPLDITVVLLRVLEPSTPPLAEGMREDLDACRRDAEEYLALIAAALRCQGVDVAWQLRRGRVVEEILAAAEESHADLIAMADQGRAGLCRFPFGAVAEAVLGQTTVPVIMIRQPEAVAPVSATKEASR